jgi:low temperature requirement protein LtrA
VGVSRSGFVHHASRYLESSHSPPTVYTGDRGRHATWLELFFDLVYVGGVAALLVCLTVFEGFTTFLDENTARSL